MLGNAYLHSVLATCRLPPDQRRIPIATIAARTLLDADGVEFLLMRAMSLKLVEGSIDSIDSSVNITHVAPRVLTPAELNGLKGHLKSWVGKVETAASLLASEGVSAVEAFA
jgi:26S proteasome regulatory subunit N9